MIDERLRSACNVIDHLVNLDWKLRVTVITEFYKAARALYGEPLVLAGARRLIDPVTSGDVVVLATGNVVGPSYMPGGETDGPGGTAILARALRLGLGAIPVIVTDIPAGGQTETVMRAAGFVATTPENLQRSKQEFAEQRERRLMATTVFELPPEDEGSQKQARWIMDAFRPKAVIAVEKSSMNEKGHYHSSTGFNTSAVKGRADFLFRIAEQENILTIGIGDGGNEIGYGVIQDVVKRFKPYGDKCRCPCGGGIAAATGTDVLITADVSNWGAYGLAAALLLLLEKPELIHDDDLELRVLEATARAGLIHMGSEVAPSVDSFPRSTNRHIAALIRDIAVAYSVDRYASKRFLDLRGTA